MLRKILKNDKGLTLVELLAVIVILGIIAAIAVPSIGNIIEKSRADAVKAEGIQVLNAAKLYVASEGPIDNSTTLNSTQLAEYMTDNGGVEWTDNKEYSVTSSDGKTLNLNGEATKGNVTITFSSATVQDINAADSASGTIPAPPSGGGGEGQ
ncbi:hypothetical protein AS034_06405 [[Bacillus] enclensis]|uniref:Type IV pilus assembly protein PilA n=1 Tax=[Bacillus] enclensis TaxID=1402860 RepID=A0A0V8HMS5_9BACI|nr:prepilin-type N-terminal cleavage/methylation domain-containing protein [[Bacillus] enclensis]KSU63871.1 hypothetical protein AS034_06405 [[Bacillus] enclensis]SCB90989.1 type IV pilus assembly protein PilA [[Bacillus] enclensis]